MLVRKLVVLLFTALLLLPLGVRAGGNNDVPNDAPTNFIVGKVFEDKNFDCSQDFTEMSLEGVTISVTSFNGLTYYASTDFGGNYVINCLPGIYTVSVDPPSAYWGTFCGNNFALVLNGFQVDTVDFPLQPFIKCPMMQVNLSTPTLVRCNAGEYSIDYCNLGTLPSTHSKVQVDFDPNIQVTGASMPYNALGNNRYEFLVGTVALNQCGNIRVQFVLNCNAVDGLTHCSEAHIYTDTVCLPAPLNWDGSFVTLEGACEGDSVRFVIHNEGEGPMQSVKQYWVVEDEVLLRQGTFQLPINGTDTIRVEANGATMRMFAEQSTGHLTFQHPTVFVENCNGFHPGYATMFPENDGDWFLDIDCRQNEPLNPDAWLVASPSGVGNANRISRNTPVEYLIRFKNEGATPASTVEVFDTLSNLLDISSLQMGASSHNCNVTLEGNGVLHCRLIGANLLPGQWGFVQYQLTHKPAIADETVIYNRAAVLFDGNVASNTNEVFHTIGTSLFNVITGWGNTPPANGVSGVRIYPNPWRDHAEVFSTMTFSPDDRLVIYNFTGNVVALYQLSELPMKLERNELPAGLYFYAIEVNGSNAEKGKFIVID